MNASPARPGLDGDVVYCLRSNNETKWSAINHRRFENGID